MPTCSIVKFKKLKAVPSLQVHQAGAYPGVSGVKQLRVQYSLWIGRRSIAGLTPDFAVTHFQLSGLEQCEIKCLAQGHTHTVRSGDRTHDLAIMSPTPSLLGHDFR